MGKLAVSDAEFEQRERTNRLIGDLVRGRVGFEEARAGLQCIQQERPLALQIASETFNPLGALETLIPVGRVSGDTRTGAQALRQADEALPVLKLSDPQELFSQVHDPGRLANLFKAAVEAVPGRVGEETLGPWAVRKFSFTAVADATQIIPKAQFARNVHIGETRNGVSALMREIEAVGDHRVLFDLDELNRSRTLGASIQEIMQFPGQFPTLNPAQRAWVDNAAGTVGKFSRHLSDEGVIADDIIGRVPGNYIPRIMNAFNGATLRVSRGGGRFWQVPFFKKDRLFLDVGQAAKAGYSGDHMQALQLFFEAGYKAVSDKKIVALTKPFSNSLLERLNIARPGLIREVQDSQAKLTITRAAAGIIRQFSLHVLRERVLETGQVVRTGTSRQVRQRASRAQGRTSAEQFNADLMERLDKLLRKRSPERFTAELGRIRKEIADRLVTATRQRRELVKAAQIAKRQVGADPRFGEASFPGTAFGNNVFTAAEKIKAVLPESEISTSRPCHSWKSISYASWLEATPAGDLALLLKGWHPSTPPLVRSTPA